MEPLFDLEKDKLFVLDLEDGRGMLRYEPWAMQGDIINNWLASESLSSLKQRKLFERRKRSAGKI